MNKPMILHCCGYTDTSALQWNPYNGAAQCHNCGQVYTAPQSPAQQEPVAWLVCSTNPDGSLKVEHAATWKEAAHEHINDAIVEYEVSEAGSWIVQPVYTAPQPTENLRCKSTQKRLATLWGYDKACQPLTKAQVLDLWEQTYVQRGTSGLEFARAVEAAHGITGEQQGVAE